MSNDAPNDVTTDETPVNDSDALRVESAHFRSMLVASQEILLVASKELRLLREKTERLEEGLAEMIRSELARETTGNNPGLAIGRKLFLPPNEPDAQPIAAKIVALETNTFGHLTTVTLLTAEGEALRLPPSLVIEAQNAFSGSLPSPPPLPWEQSIEARNLVRLLAVLAAEARFQTYSELSRVPWSDDTDRLLEKTIEGVVSLMGDSPRDNPIDPSTLA